MDMGADGRLFVASWRGGEAAVYVGPQVGFVACITPPGFKEKSLPHQDEPDLARLVDGLCGSVDARRFACQREIIRRGRSPEATRALAGLASDRSRPLHGRVAALFALKQLDGKELARGPAEARRRRLRPRVRPAGSGRPQHGARPASIRARSSRHWGTRRRESGHRP